MTLRDLAGALFLGACVAFVLMVVASAQVSAATCAYSTGGTTLDTSTAEAFPDCAGSDFFVLSGTEYNAINVRADLYQSLFEVPPVADLQAIFQLFFILVMTCYLVSWAYGAVIKFAAAD